MKIIRKIGQKIKEHLLEEDERTPREKYLQGFRLR